jgi:hypothetical protein
VIFGFVLLGPLISHAQEFENYNVEFEGRYWYPKLDATVKIVDNNIGTEFNPIDDLGWDDQKGFGEARFQFKFKFFGSHKFNFSFLPMKWDGDQAITQDIQFSGKTYPAGTRVQSEMDIKFYKGGYEYDFIDGWLGFLGVTFDVLVADTRIQLKAPSLGFDQKEDLTVPIPMIGINSRLHLGKYVNLTAKVSGLPAGHYGYIYDLDGSLNINPVKYVGIALGYRFFGLKAEYDDNKLDTKLQGPFAALNIRF